MDLKLIIYDDIERGQLRIAKLCILEIMIFKAKANHQSVSSIYLVTSF